MGSVGSTTTLVAMFTGFLIGMRQTIHTAALVSLMSGAVIMLTIMGLSYCVSAFMDATIAASRALGKGGVPTVIVVMGACVFRVIWVNTVFAHFGTIPSLYLLYVFSWSITAAELVYFVRIYRKQMEKI